MASILRYIRFYGQTIKIRGMTMETDKKELRNRMKKLRDEIGENENLRLSEKIAESLFNIPEYAKAENILVYVSFGSEVNTIPIIQKALEQGKNVGVPRIDDKNMNFYQIGSLEELKPGFYGIPEPDGTHTKTFKPENALVLLPGLVFDKKMSRIGYGGGYYDKYLSQSFAKKYLKLALTFEFQVLNEELLCIDPYDIPIDGIITESQIHKAGLEKTN